MNRDSVYLRHILDAALKIESYVSVGRDTFLSTSHWQDAVIRQLEIIGEAVKNISEPLHNNLKEVIELCLEEFKGRIKDLPHFVGLQQIEVS